MSSPIAQAIKQICEEKNISYESVLETIEAALAAAYRKDFGEKNQNIKVKFDPETGSMRIFDVKMVVEDMELPEEGEEAAPLAPLAEGEIAEPKFNPKTMIMISEAKKLKPDAEMNEEIRTELDIPGAFGRMAAQTAKQVIMQKLREAEREVVFAEYKDKEGQIVVATVQRREARNVLFDIGKTTAVMPPEEQSPQDRYASGERMKVYVSRVALTTRGAEITISRSHAELIRQLFMFEIPEVANGIVEIKAIAREAGGRTKIAVATSDTSIDPIGSCIGQRGTRIQTIISEIGGEKIDVVAWNENPEVFIAHALAPAKVQKVELHEAEHGASVQVAPDQLSLAIGRGGQNVRLAARLTGWKINVVGGEAVAEATPEGEIEEGTKDASEAEEKK
ncbi:MAG: transcription termination factor NusA [bacterium]|nr:transcription termination factor NusA [bacterium]